MTLAHAGQYSLPPHVHTCISDGLCIWLDTRRDRYYATPSQGAFLITVESSAGQPAKPGDGRPPNDSDAHVTPEALLKRGLLTKSRKAPPTIERAVLSVAHRSLAHEEPQTACRLTVVSLWRALRAYSVAVATLRFVSLRHALQSVARIKQGHHARFAEGDIHEVHIRVSMFRRARTLLYSSRGRCLVDSLAMMRFLMTHKIYPTLVIGVTGRPFRAHCWLQHGDVVLNDDPAFTGSFVPIVSI
jgi:hypothetical protein